MASELLRHVYFPSPVLVVFENLSLQYGKKVILATYEIYSSNKVNCICY
jgi:hypothetical protein